jgi:DNA-binding PadR family transcriptional regulator
MMTKSSGAQRKFTTIEMTVLGMTWLRGPCTIYAVMMELSSSASSYHKSRAGTAYSVAKRLLNLALIEETDAGKVKVTAAGEEQLRHWIGPNVPMMDVAHSADLLRLRFFFLGALPAPQRLEFIDQSIASLKVFLERCDLLIDKNEEIGDYFGALATVSSVLETRARIRWLELVRELVEEPMTDRHSWTSRIRQLLPTD